MKRALPLSIFFLLSNLLFPQEHVSEVRHLISGKFEQYVQTPTIFHENWNKRTEIIFWKTLMQLEPDMSMIYAPRTRKILSHIPTIIWKGFDRYQRYQYLQDIRKQYNIKGKLFVAQGKSHFYRFHQVLPELKGVIDIFHRQGVDPWYAQSVLMIESPGQLLTSTAGAYGPFQLMKSVGKAFGLTINEHKDERASYTKSALAAAKFFKTACIPETEMLLHRAGISYHTSDLWFKLLVLHVYHAGAGNVQKAILKTGIKKGGMNLITSLWNSSEGGFQNCSQNYSQLALAAHICMEELVHQEYSSICHSGSYEYLELLTVNE